MKKKVQNDMGEETAKCLSEIIKTNSSIKHFYISGNSLGSEGCIEVSNALQQNNTIEELYTSVNRVNNFNKFNKK